MFCGGLLVNPVSQAVWIRYGFLKEIIDFNKESSSQSSFRGGSPLWGAGPPGFLIFLIFLILKKLKKLKKLKVFLLFHDFPVLGYGFLIEIINFLKEWLQAGLAGWLAALGGCHGSRMAGWPSWAMDSL